MKTLNDNCVILTIPPSLKNDDKFKAFTIASDNELKKLFYHLDDGIILAAIDSLSTDVLDHVAAQWKANVWRDSWPVEIKRSVLKSLITEKSRQGTLSAVKNAVSSMGSAAYITEWWEKEPKATPHTFEVAVDQTKIEGIVDEELTYDLRRMIDAAKPVRSQYTFSIIQKASGNIYASASSREIVYARIRTSERLARNSQSQIIFNHYHRPISYTRISDFRSIPSRKSTGLNLIISSAFRSTNIARIGYTEKPQLLINSTTNITKGVTTIQYSRVSDFRGIPSNKTITSSVSIGQGSRTLTISRVK